MQNFFINIFLLIFFITNLVGQEEISMTGNFLPYETYYIGSIDLSTGATDVQLFNFFVSSTAKQAPYEPPINFHISFKLEIHSPYFGFSEKETLIEVKTNNMLSMKNPINLDNRDFDINNLSILDVTGDVVLDENGQQIDMEIVESLDIEKYENILSSITSMGKLPNGDYYISLYLLDDSGSKLASKEKTFNINTSSSLNLIYPGGNILDTTQNIIYTSLPVFQWSTEPCISCELFIRVAEFDSENHNSLDDAIEDVTSLPIDQIEGWRKIENNTSFQYPTIGAWELEVGKLYVWQIKKEVQTTLGVESYLSPISIFKIAEISMKDMSKINILSHPILIALKNIIGEESFNIYFGADGEFANYSPANIYKINNENCTSDDIMKIIDQLKRGTISIVDLNIE